MTRKIIIKDNLILIILILFLLIQTISLFRSPDIWWDSSVYLSMGKSIYSFGKVGLWEASRPIVWPIILGFFWRIGLNPIFSGKIITILFSLGCIFLTYNIAKKAFNETIALISALFLAFSPTFFLFSSVLQTEIPSLFLILLTVGLFIKKKYALSGLFLSIGVMARFFVIFAITPLLLYLFLKAFKEKKYRSHSLLFFLSFLIPILSYLILNWFLYGNAIYPFILQAYMTQNTGWVFNQPFYFYFLGLIKENFFILFSILGIISVCQTKNNNKLFILSVFLFTFIPFNLIAHKEMRFLLLSLPYLYMLASYGLINFFKLFAKKQKLGIILALLVWSLFTIPNLRYNQYEDNLDIFYDYIENVKINGPLWISNPAFITYSDYKANLIYYPNFNNQKIQKLNLKLMNAEHILINTCDIPCPPKEEGCEQNKRRLIEKLKNNFKTVKFNQIWKCEMYIFEK